MDQLARLVTVFDQEGAQQLIKSLKDVQTNSKGAETATEQLTDATKKAAPSVKLYSGAVNDMNTHVKLFADYQKKAAESTKTFSLGVDQMSAHVAAYKKNLADLKVANDNAAKSSRALGAAGLNLGRQFSDVGVSLAGGINPLMVLIQQGPQIADGFAVASAAGLSFKAVIGGLYAQIAPLVVAFAPLIAGIGAVSAAVFVLVDAHQKQDKAIKDLTTSLAAQKKELNDLSPWIFLTGENSNLAADGQRNFDTWLKKANVSLAEQNRLLRENMLNELNKKALAASENLRKAQEQFDKANKAGPSMMAGGMGGFGTLSAPQATDPKNNPFYKEAAENLRIAKEAAEAIGVYQRKAGQAPDTAFAYPVPKGRKPPKDTLKEIAKAKAIADGRYATSGAQVIPLSSIASVGQENYTAGHLNKFSPGQDRTIGGDPMLTSAEDASKQLQAILDKRAKSRLETEKAMWSGLTALSSSGNKKLAAIGKAAAIAEATIDGIKAVQKAYASLPFPFNLAAAATMAGLTAINVAKIAGVQGFEAGGYTGGGGQKQVAGVVHGQEFVVNAAATRQNRDTLEAMNAGRAVPKNQANDNGRRSRAQTTQNFYSLGSGNLITETVYRDFDRKIAQSQAETLRAAPMVVARHQGQKR